MSKKVMTRRSFFKSAAAGAAAVSLPMIVPSTVFGANAPSNRICLGFIGMGKRSDLLWSDMLYRPDVQLLACCDVESVRREERRDFANEYYGGLTGKSGYNSVEACGDYRDILRRDDIDGVVIATPDHWHALMVVEAAAAGKDIFCEKPLSLTIREARCMVDAVRRYGRICQTGSQQRSMWMFRKACEIVRNGWIGEVKKVHVAIGGPSGPCDLPAEKPFATLDWDRWLGPAPWRPYNAVLCPDHTRSFPRWRSYRDYSGGGMTDWGAHHFDIAQWALNMDHSGPVEIIPPGQGVDRLTYRYANGVEMVHGGVELSNGVEFFGTEGVVRVNRNLLETEPASLARKPVGSRDIRLYRSEDHAGDWLDCMRSRSRPICDIEIGARSVTVCHLGNIAFWTGRRLEWDPRREELTSGGAEARSWLDRTCREPWTL